MLARGKKPHQKINLLLSSVVQRHQELWARAQQKSWKEGGTGPTSRHRIAIATTTQTKNKTGQIHWKRAKLNMETKYGLRIGIQNIKTLREKEEVTLLMEERRLNIYRISETREKISGGRFIHNDYICLRSGDDGGKHGVAFIIAPEITHLVEIFVPINNRMAGMILKTGTSRILCMTVYAPQQGRNDEEKDRFFLHIHEEIDKLRQNVEVIVMGDLNGHVGQRTEGYEQVIGHRGIGQRNTEGDRISTPRKPQVHIWYGWNGTKQQYDRQTQMDLFLVTNHCKTRHTIKKLKPAEKKKRVNSHNLQMGKT